VVRRRLRRAGIPGTIGAPRCWARRKTFESSGPRWPRPERPGSRTWTIPPNIPILRTGKRKSAGRSRP